MVGKPVLLQNYFDLNEDLYSVSRQQGSDFAKRQANDFNPLHDVDAKRFVVPGDLLFSLVLHSQGVSKKMGFEFAGMVNDETRFQIRNQGSNIEVADEQKVYTKVAVSGECHTDAQFIAQLSDQYVKFSGTTYPHILVPLMRDKGVMINPARPMVMYQSMSLALDSFADGVPTLEMSHNEFTVEGKRGDVYLHFNVLVDGKVIGHGSKHMLLSGLRPYEEAAITQLTAEYDGQRNAFAAA